MKKKQTKIEKIKKDPKIHLDDLQRIYDYIATRAQCPDHDFDDFVTDLGNSAMKEGDSTSGFGPELYQMYAGFAVGFVYGNAVTVQGVPEKIKMAMDKIRKEMVREELFPGISLR
jgi:hypothetical protein